MKRRIFTNLAIFSLIVLATLGGNALLSLTEHPAFTHNDYVFGQRMVIDNETPFEYDAALALPDRDRGIGLVTYGDPTFTWEHIRDRYGNKILREKDGHRYTVYSAEDNNLYYVFFNQDENGNWGLCTEGLYDTVHSAEGEFWDEYVYEWDLPAAILGDAVPRDTICAEDAMIKLEDFQNDLYAIRYNLKIDDLQTVMLRDEIAQAYRMTIDTMSDGVYLFEFHIYTDNTGALTYRRYNSETGLTNKGLFDDVTYPLTQTETEALLSVWTEADFFNLSPVHPYDTASFLDGQYIYLEGMADLWRIGEDGVFFYNYHMIGLRDQTLIYPELFSIHDTLIALVEEKGTEVKFNFRSEEEKLREVSEK